MLPVALSTERYQRQSSSLSSQYHTVARHHDGTRGELQCTRRREHSKHAPEDINPSQVASSRRQADSQRSSNNLSLDEPVYNNG